MASIVKRGSKWLARVKKGEFAKAKSFDTKKDAREWAADLEAELMRGRHSSLPNKKFGELMDRYAEEVSPSKKGGRWEEIRLRKLGGDLIAGVTVAELDPSHVAEWRDRRIKEVSSSSVLREWSLLSHVCTVAVKEWRWLNSNPFLSVTKPKKAKPRDRRPTSDEIERLIHTLDYRTDSDLTKIMSRVGAMFLLAIETAMRASEMSGMTWEHVHLDQSYVHLPDTKNGFPRDVPLSDRAIEIIEQARQINRGEGSVFDVTPSQIDSLFRKAKKAAMVKGLRFHDSRREALSRMAKKMNIMQLARISGHRDLRILQTVYYSPDVSELVDLVK